MAEVTGRVNWRAGRVVVTVAGLLLVVALCAWFGGRSATPLKVVTLDFAYYNPGSIVLKKFGWLEEALKSQGIGVRWVFSAGSNRAIEYLNGSSVLDQLSGDSVQFASTAGLSAVLARANGSQIKSVYVYSRPEWVALVVSQDSVLHSVQELRGKTIAATRGTDAHLFLLRALKEAGIRRSEVNIVNLQHADGREAMNEDRVDAWAGLDPHMAASELEEGSRLLYRNLSFNTYGFLNVNQQFAASHPDIVRIVIQNYERARHWIQEHPDEAVRMIADEANISIEVARRQLWQRTDLSHPVIGAGQIQALNEAAPILLEEGMVPAGTVVYKVIADLIDDRYVRAVVR